MRIGRKMAAAKKTPGLRVRLGEDQFARYVQAQRAAGDRTLSDWARRMLDVCSSGQPPPISGADPEYREALDRIRAHILQADDGPAIRYAVVRVAKLLDDPSVGEPAPPREES